MDNEPTVIIIKKVKKGGHEGHHGSAWKVAYADFVTAMMAFFLLLWLLNVATEEQKQGIADYFAPTSASRSLSGAGGVLSGRSMDSRGARVSEMSRMSVTLDLSPPNETVEEEQEGEEEQPQRGSGSDEGAEFDARPEGDQGQKSVDAEVDDETVEAKHAELEQRRFEEAERALRQAIQDIPELAELAQHLIIDQTPEGLRIQIVDQAAESMFPSGSAQMYDHTRLLLVQIARVIRQLPNRIAISGHTDARPFRNDSGYSNWELSTDRANASRRALIAAGVSPDRIDHITGKADKDPLFAEDPFLPNNRRISIVLLREALAPPGATN